MNTPSRTHPTYGSVKLATVGAYFILPFLLACAHTGAIQESSETTGQNQQIADPQQSHFSRHHLAGIKQCGLFPLTGAADRCRAYEGCEQRGSAFFENELENRNLALKERLRLFKRLGNLNSNSAATLPKAIRSFEQALRLIDGEISKTGTSESKTGWSALRYEFLGLLGIAELRLAEVENTLNSTDPTIGEFPRLKKPRYKKLKTARLAKSHFIEMLSLDPNDVQIKWLLNLTMMSLGEYPDGLPENLKIELTSTGGFPRFLDRSAAAGVNKKATGAGAAVVDDFNEDGLLDIIIAPKLECLGLLYFENDGRGGFMDKSAASGLWEHKGVRSVLQADYDNDGHLDLYLARGGFLMPAENLPVSNSLLRGEGRGRFVDVSEHVGLNRIRNSGGAANWVDFDRDGWIDVFVCNYEDQANLFKNNKGQFSDVAQQVGISNLARCKGVAWGDVNDDGWPDLFIANFNEKPHRLLVNRGGKEFTTIQNSPTDLAPRLGYSPIFVDYDNDGDLDLFISTFNLSIEPFLLSLQHLPNEGESAALFLNDGNGNFVNRAAELGLGDLPMMAKGANFGDLNGDGWLDLIVGSAKDGLGDLGPQMAFINDRGMRLINVTYDMGLGYPRKGNGVSFADLSNHGQQDVIMVNGGSAPSDMHAPSIYQNPGFPHHWVTIQLVGSVSNRSAIGARIQLVVRESSGERRYIYKTISSGGSFGANPLRAEIGIGKAEAIEEVVIRWPNGRNTESRFKKLPIDRFVRITEGRVDFEVVDLPHVK